MSNKKAQRAKEAMGYIKPNRQAKCANCKSYGPMVLGQPATPIQPPIQFVPPHCKLGNFAVHPEAVCNDFDLRLKPHEKQSMNPGLLDDIPEVRKQDVQMRRAAQAFGAERLPRLAGEWSR